MTSTNALEVALLMQTYICVFEKWAFFKYIYIYIYRWSKRILTDTDITKSRCILFPFCSDKCFWKRGKGYSEILKDDGDMDIYRVRGGGRAPCRTSVHALVPVAS